MLEKGKEVPKGGKGESQTDKTTRRGQLRQKPRHYTEEKGSRVE